MLRIRQVNEQQINAALNDIDKSIGSMQTEAASVKKSVAEENKNTQKVIEGLSKRLDNKLSDLDSAIGNNIEYINNHFVPNTRTVNGKSLSNNIELTASDVGAATVNDITNAINDLDVASAGGAGKYISEISESNGKISATATTMDTTPTANSTNAVTSGGIKSAIDTAESNAKNLANATGTLPVANGGTGQTDLNNVTVGKALNGVWGRLGGANLSSKSTFTALITEELTGSNFGGGICGGSINTSAADKGIPAGWYNYLYVPHRTGIGGGDNYKFGTLYVTPMTSNSDSLYIIHYYGGAVQNAKVFKADGTGIATAVKDSGNGTNTTFAYSKAGLTGNPSWLAAWNGYELRAIAPSQITAGTASNLNGRVQKATKTFTTLDLSSLDASKWYPCTIPLDVEGWKEIECYVSLNSGTKPSWSSHNGGFSCHLHLFVMRSGWGTTAAQTLVLDRSYSFTTVNGVTVIPTGWTQMTNSSTGVLWLRGGGKYFVWNSNNDTFTIRTSTYTASDQSVSPTTTYQWSFNRANTFGYFVGDLSGNATTATTANRIRTSAPSSPVNGDIWIE